MKATVATLLLAAALLYGSLELIGAGEAATAAYASRIELAQAQ